MNLQEAREVGAQVAAYVQSGETERAMGLLSPILAQRVKFPLLGEIGKKIGEGPIETTNAFLPHVAATNAEGGWPIIGMALNAQFERAHYNMALSYMNQRKNDKARQALNDYMRHRPEDARALRDLAFLDAADGRFGLVRTCL